MARAVWWALVLGTLVSGARYGDYSDAKMSEYGSAIDYDGPRDSPIAPATDAEDYHEHAQEPLALEYKYEEDQIKSDKRVKEVGESNEWQNTDKKHKKYSNMENQENFDTYSSDELTSNFKSNLKPLRHRPRPKPRNSHIDDSKAQHNNPARYIRNRKKEFSDTESQEKLEVIQDDFEDDKRIDFDEDQTHIDHRETTVRTIRRKPRDRFVKSESKPDEEDPITNLRRRPVKDEFRPEEISNARPMMRRPQYRPDAGSREKEGGELRSRRVNPKNYDEFAEYYDMKRVQGIKEKLFKEKILEPRRSTTIYPFRTRTRLRTQRVNEDAGLEGLRRLMRPYSATARYDNPNEQYVDVSPGFPLANPTFDRYNDYDTEVITGVTETSTFAPLLRVSIIDTTSTPETTTTSTTMTTTTTRTTTTTMATKKSPKSRKPHKTTTKSEEEEVETTKPSPAEKSSTDMSLAEKSRLSILKKAQRKEMLKEFATTKPPVLLQVKNRLHTLVMVEPVTSMRPWQHVSEIQQDTLDNVLKVKRLMRKKLVENAKDIHDLSENWDDMVCDYIDMALLDKKAASTASLHIIPMFISFIAILLH